MIFRARFARIILFALSSSGEGCSFSSHLRTCSLTIQKSLSSPVRTIRVKFQGRVNTSKICVPIRSVVSVAINNHIIVLLKAISVPSSLHCHEGKLPRRFLSPCSSVFGGYIGVVLVFDCCCF